MLIANCGNFGLSISKRRRKSDDGLKEIASKNRKILIRLLLDEVQLIIFEEVKFKYHKKLFATFGSSGVRLFRCMKRAMDQIQNDSTKRNIVTQTMKDLIQPVEPKKNVLEYRRKTASFGLFDV